MEVIVKRRALLEVQEAFARYEGEHAGLGLEFLRCVEAGLAQIARAPLSRPLYYAKARRLYLRRFPFSIYYIVEEAFISIAAVFHSRRDPRVLFSRLEDEGA